ncbi:MAG: glycosyltransferase 87 family protein [Pseudonocardiaceae bacterium]
MTARVLRILLPAGLVVAWALVIWRVLGGPPGFIDLTVYRAGGYAWAHGIPLYGPQFPALIELLPLPFTYPPISAVLFASLAAVPFPLAAVLLAAASLACLVFVGWLTAWRLEPDRWRVIQLTGAAVVLGTLTEPVRETLTFGQVNLLLMALVAADCLLPRTPWPRGALIGLAAAIKLTPAMFVLFFVAHRQWRPVLAAGAAFVVATAVGFLAAPGPSVQYWFGGVLTDPSRIGSPGFPSNQSLAGVLHRWELPAAWQIGIWLLGALAVVAAGWVAVRRLCADGHDVAALLAVAATGLLASPVSWSHHYVWAVPALIWFAHRAGRSWQRWAGAAALAGVFVVGPHWLVATREDNTPHWGIGAQIVGNAYVWVAVVALLAAAFGRYAPWSAAGEDPGHPSRRGGQQQPARSGE